MADETLSVEIIAKISQLQAGMSEAAASVTGATGEMTAAVETMATDTSAAISKVKASVMGLGSAIIAGFGVSKLVEMVNHTAKVAENFKLLSETTGISTDKLQGLKYASEQVNVSWEMASRALVVLNHNMLMAAENSGTASLQLQTFASLGLDKAALSGMTTAQVLAVVADKFHNTADPIHKAGIAMALFGRAGAGLVPLLDEGSAGIAQLTAKAKSLGLVMSGEDINAASAYANELKNMKAAAQGLEQEFAIKLMPLFSQITAQMEDNAKGAQKDGSAMDALKNAITGIVIVLEALVSVFRAVVDIGKLAADSLVDSFTAAATVMDDVMHGRMKQAVADGKSAWHSWTEDMKTDFDAFTNHIASGFNRINDMALGVSAPAAPTAAPAAAPGADTGGIGDVGGGGTGKVKETHVKVVLDKPPALHLINTTETKNELDHLESSWAKTMKDVKKLTQPIQEDVGIVFRSINQAFDQTVIGVIRGTETWRQGMKKMGASILQEEIKNYSQQLTHWMAVKTSELLFGQKIEAAKSASVAAGSDQTNKIVDAGQAIAMRTLGKSAGTQIGTNAAVAASGSAASASSIPIVGWAMAAEVAAVILAVVLGFKSLVSAEGGWDNVSADQLAMIHKNEMVLPAPIAQAARDTFSGGGRRGGGTTNHFHVNAMDSRSIHEALRRNPGAVVGGLTRAAKMGMRP